MKTTILIFLFFPFILLAQNFEGQVQDVANQEAVAYVNIGLIGKNIGTVSDDRGHFLLTIKNATPTDTLQFSMIGYTSKIMTLAEFVDNCKDNCVIQLEKQAYDLAEVVVIPKDFKTKIVGNKSKNKNISAGFEKNILGYEMGVHMKIKKRPTYVESVTLNIAKCEYDSIFYRLNIYDMKNKKPHQNVLKEPIYLSYSKEEVGESLVIDLSDKNVYVENDFFVTVELVNSLGTNGLYFCAGLFNNRTVFRETSQGTWDSIPVGIGISAKIRQEK